jgi:DNA helicase-2/ATP-dependent DNA helicase PcrA
MSPFKPRPGQQQIMTYGGGLMGVSAVPGSGKTATIANLAARLVREGPVGGGNVLVVTYQNAAVDTIKTRVRSELGHVASGGYDVRTLHSLAYGIIQEQPALAGTTTEFHVVDERTRTDLLDKATRLWSEENRSVWEPLAVQGKSDWHAEWIEVAHALARSLIATGKNHRTAPERGLLLAETLPPGTVRTLLEAGMEIYRLYQQNLTTIGGLDFDDLVRLALDLITSHEELAQRLRRQWPIVLEDEAQDSIPLQEELLRQLAGGADWIRVGDPNQSIMSTFTAANPRYLRRFLDRDDVQTVEMLISGRCARPIFELANHLVEWVCTHHPLQAVRARTFRSQRIHGAEAGDSQENPSDEESGILFREYNDRDDELRDIARRAHGFTLSHPDKTAAILVPTNRVGTEMVECLRQQDAAFDEVLQTSRRSRETCDALGSVLAYLADPLRAKALDRAFQAVCERGNLCEQDTTREGVSRLLRSCYRPEVLIFPNVGARSEEAFPPIGPISEIEMVVLDEFAGQLRRWLMATSLPIDQLVLTLAQDLFEDDELASAQRIAVYLRGKAEQNGHWRLPDFAAELEAAIRGHSTIFTGASTEFQPRPGRITLTTMHKAKGLEWDLVYLVGVDGEWFPHDLSDRFRGEREFLGADPAEETKAALLQLLGESPSSDHSATDDAHVEIIAERLRLLYVGITRARRYLGFSWSQQVTMFDRTRRVPPAAMFSILQTHYRDFQQND